MNNTIPVTHCPALELVQLPSKEVLTGDGKPIKLGSLLYFRYTPVPSAAEYVVVSDRAIRKKEGFQIIAVGPSGFIAGMNPKDLVADKKEWWAFYQKRYGAP